MISMAEAEALTTCTNVGVALPDIAGTGIIISFAGQALVSLAVATWIFLLSRHGGLDLKHEEGTREREIETRRIEFATEILTIGADDQLMLGYAYLIQSISSVSTYNLYHLRLSFDIICFVGISNATALVCWTFAAAKIQDSNSPYHLDQPLLSRRAGRPARPKSLSEAWTFVKYFILSPRVTHRHRITLFFCAFFIVYVGLLNYRMNQWSYDPESNPINCYITHLSSAPDASQPSTDKTYINVTAIWMMASLLSSLFGPVRIRRTNMISALLQFPVHLYMMIVLRISNQDYLKDGESENDWDFGQTTAMLFFVRSLKEVAFKSWEFYKFYKSEEVQRLSRAQTQDPDTKKPDPDTKKPDPNTKKPDPDTSEIRSPLKRLDTSGLESGEMLNLQASQRSGVAARSMPNGASQANHDTDKNTAAEQSAYEGSRGQS